MAVAIAETTVCGSAKASKKPSTLSKIGRAAQKLALRLKGSSVSTGKKSTKEAKQLSEKLASSAVFRPPWMPEPEEEVDVAEQHSLRRNAVQAVAESLKQCQDVGSFTRHGPSTTDMYPAEQQQQQQQQQQQTQQQVWVQMQVQVQVQRRASRARRPSRPSSFLLPSLPSLPSPSLSSARATPVQSRRPMSFHPAMFQTSVSGMDSRRHSWSPAWSVEVEPLHAPPRSRHPRFFSAYDAEAQSLRNEMADEVKAPEPDSDNESDYGGEDDEDDEGDSEDDIYLARPAISRY